MKKLLIVIALLLTFSTACESEEKRVEREKYEATKIEEGIAEFIEASKNDENKWTDETKIKDMIPVKDKKGKIVQYMVQLETNGVVNGGLSAHLKNGEITIPSWNYGGLEEIEKHPGLITGEAEYIHMGAAKGIIIKDGDRYFQLGTDYETDENGKILKNK